MPSGAELLLLHLPEKICSAPCLFPSRLAIFSRQIVGCEQTASCPWGPSGLPLGTRRALVPGTASCCHAGLVDEKVCEHRLYTRALSAQLGCEMQELGGRQGFYIKCL